MKTEWFVYILKCADGTFYTGITTDVARRVKEHNESAKGAKYTRVRRPLTLHYSEAAASRSDAAKREYELRTLSHKQKKQLRA